MYARPKQHVLQPCSTRCSMQSMELVRLVPPCQRRQMLVRQTRPFCRVAPQLGYFGVLPLLPEQVLADAASPDFRILSNMDRSHISQMSLMVAPDPTRQIIMSNLPLGSWSWIVPLWLVNLQGLGSVSHGECDCGWGFIETAQVTFYCPYISTCEIFNTK